MLACLTMAFEPVELRSHEDAVSVQRPGHRALSIFGAQWPADLDRLMSGARAQMAGAEGFIDLRDEKATVLCQFARIRGFAGASQIGGCRAEQPPVQGEPARSQAPVGRLADSH